MLFSQKFPDYDYLDQYRELELKVCRWNLIESIYNLYWFENHLPFQVIDIRHQVDHITPKKIQLFEEFITDPLNANARLFVILVRHRQMEMISDGNDEITEVKFI